MSRLDFIDEEIRGLSILSSIGRLLEMIDSGKFSNDEVEYMLKIIKGLLKKIYDKAFNDYISLNNENIDDDYIDEFEYDKLIEDLQIEQNYDVEYLESALLHEFNKYIKKLFDTYEL